MRKLLLLGGTIEAREIARTLADKAGIEVVSSLAGRVRNPTLPDGVVRVGGFGGVDGLRDWLSANHITAIIDATHPFAGTITSNAARAAAATRLPILHLRRPGWREGPDDRWLRVPTPAAAADAVAKLGRQRVLLTIGRQGVGAFAHLDRPWFLIRSIDAPDAAIPPRHELLQSRGPFTLADERSLLAARGIDLVVTKDSGGAATEAKLDAAREASIAVVMIDRPGLPEGAVTADTVADALAWLDQPG